MKIEPALASVVLATADGVVHAPFTIYLNEHFSNPNTLDAVRRSLRLLLRLADAFDIDLAGRALKGRLLTEVEKKALRQLVFLPVQVAESMSDRAVRQVASVRKRTSQGPSRLVESNTASKHLVHIADFLVWYHDRVLDPRLPVGSPTAQALAQDVAKCTSDLKRAVGKTKTSHPHQIRSVPAKRFLEIYSALFLVPHDVFQATHSDGHCNLLRDRSMVLLAAEGVRPGAIGNFALADFTWGGGSEPGYIRIRDNLNRRAKRVTTGTPRQKGIASSQQYSSELLMKLWPTTAMAIQAYIDGERKAVTAKTLRNKSKGFLFLAEHGGAIGDRSTINNVFKRAGLGLRQLGLLARAKDDPYLDGEHYDFCPYLLRHSAASLFYASKLQEAPDEVVQDLMKLRFGWSQQSSQPKRYAQRAMSDAASVTVNDFMDSLLEEARGSRQDTRGAQ